MISFFRKNSIPIEPGLSITALPLSNNTGKPAPVILPTDAIENEEPGMYLTVSC